MTVAANVKGTLASLKNVAGTLKLYCSESRKCEVKNIFEEAFKETSDIITDLENRIKVLEYEEPQYKGN
jgi:hypothetical protein